MHPKSFSTFYINFILFEDFWSFGVYSVFLLCWFLSLDGGDSRVILSNILSIFSNQASSLIMPTLSHYFKSLILCFTYMYALLMLSLNYCRLEILQMHTLQVNIHSLLLSLGINCCDLEFMGALITQQLRSYCLEMLRRQKWAAIDLVDSFDHTILIITIMSSTCCLVP